MSLERNGAARNLMVQLDRGASLRSIDCNCFRNVAEFLRNIDCSRRKKALHVKGFFRTMDQTLIGFYRRPGFSLGDFSARFFGLHPRLGFTIGIDTRGVEIAFGIDFLTYDK